MPYHWPLSELYLKVAESFEYIQASLFSVELSLLVDWVIALCWSRWQLYCMKVVYSSFFSATCIRRSEEERGEWASFESRVKSVILSVPFKSLYVNCYKWPWMKLFTSHWNGATMKGESLFDQNSMSECLFSRGLPEELLNFSSPCSVALGWACGVSSTISPFDSWSTYGAPNWNFLQSCDSHHHILSGVAAGSRAVAGTLWVAVWSSSNTAQMLRLCSTAVERRTRVRRDLHVSLKDCSFHIPCHCWCVMICTFSCVCSVSHTHSRLLHAWLALGQVFAPTIHEPACVPNGSEFFGNQDGVIIFLWTPHSHLHFTENMNVTTYKAESNQWKVCQRIEKLERSKHYGLY